MDKRKCNQCGKDFNFDKEGLGCGEIVVCGEKCAKASAKNRGNRYAIHNHQDKIIDTDADGTEKTHYF